MPFNNGLTNQKVDTCGGQNRISKLVSKSYRPAFPWVLDGTNMGSIRVPFDNIGPKLVPCGLTGRGILVL